MTTVTDGTYRDVRWFVEKGKPGCEHPYVTIQDSDGLFLADEVPGASPAHVHKMIDAELERRGKAAARSASRTGRSVA